MWLADKAGLKELQYEWTMNEVYIANELLDAQEEAEAEARMHAEAKHRNKSR